MNFFKSNEKDVAEMGKTRVLGYQLARVLTDQELLAVAGALICPRGQQSTWSPGSSECNCTVEDDCR
jgi:hypothetical protein